MKYLIKYNTLKLKENTTRSAWAKVIEQIGVHIAELESEIDYYKSKYKNANSQIRQLKDRIAKLEQGQFSKKSKK